MTTPERSVEEFGHEIMPVIENKAERSVDEIVQDIKDEISPDGKTIHCGGEPYSNHFSRITKTLQAERQRREEIVLKGERRRIIEQIREERDTYWKERVRKEVEGMKGIYDENGLQTQWIQKAELLQAVDNLK